jgi:hypothetical protein
MGNVKEEYLRRDLSSASLDASHANERAAALEKDAQALKAANLSLEARIQPRRISGEIAKRMSNILAQLGRVPIAIVSRLLDSESNDFADDLQKVFVDATWQVVRVRNWTKSDKGVFIASRAGTALPSDLERVIAAALDADATAHKTTTVADNDIGTISPQFEPNVLYLLVGVKP